MNTQNNNTGSGAPNTSANTTPPAATGGTANITTPPSLDLQDVTVIAPPDAPADTLDPLSGAGVLLTKIVLGILSGVLLLLLLMFIWQESRFAEVTNSAFKSSVASAHGAPDKLKQQELLLPVLQSLRKAKNGSEPDQANLLADAAGRLKGNEEVVSQPALKKLVLEIETVAKDKDHSTTKQKIDELLATAEMLSKDAGPEETVELLKARQELLKTSLETINAAREFWSRTAQMILLNLLLPVLTALLGYVFASRNASK